MKKHTFFFCLVLFGYLSLQAQTFKSNNGVVVFKSDAPLEMIEAASNAMRGALDIPNRSFAFSIDTKTFRGFNSILQQEHFYENYLETEKFPISTFTGKLIEVVDFSVPGTYTVRAKGQMVIHGVTQERIIKSTVVVTATSIKVSANFTVLLDDYNIRVPRIVNQKIAQEIDIRINTVLVK